MTVNIYEFLHEKFSGVASPGLGEVLNRSTSESGAITSKSIDAVLDSFSGLTDDANARERLYAAVIQSDERAVDDPGVVLRGRDRQAVLADSNNKLANIVGIANKNRIAENLRTSTGLSATESDEVLGYIVPGVLGGMKKQISAGVVANSSVGLTHLFRGGKSGGAVANANTGASGTLATNTGAANTGAANTGRANTGAVSSGTSNTGAVSSGTSNTGTSNTGAVPVAQATEKSTAYANTSHVAAGTSGHTAVAASGEVSWWRRLALPFLLLGALLLGTIKYCSNIEHTRIVAQDRDSLQSELAVVREEAESSTTQVANLSTELDGAKANVASLTTELEDANANVTRLQGEVDTISVELEEVKAVPTDTAELQGLLASALSLIHI